MKAKTGQSDLLTAKETQAFLRVSAATFYRLTAAGKLPEPIRILPRMPRWRRSDLEAYVASLSNTGAA